MVIGERVQERLKAMGLSQAELARRVGVSQPTINNLIHRSKKGSTQLHRIARCLGTTTAYLEGEVDDPDVGAPPPERPAIPLLMLPVALPSQDALAEMFEGLLEAIDRTAPVDVLARELAQLLPTGLGQLRGLLSDAQARLMRQAAEGEIPAIAGPEPTR